MTYFIRLPSNEVPKRIVGPHLCRPVGRPLKSGVRVKVFDFEYHSKSWKKARRMVYKIEWYQGELFPRVGFIVTNSNLPARKAVKVYNGGVRWRTESRKARTR